MNVLRITPKKAFRELASCLTLKSRSFGAQKKGSPHIPGSSSSAILGAMDSVDPADAQPAAGVEDELSRLGRCRVQVSETSSGLGEGVEVSEFPGHKMVPLSQRKSLPTIELFLSTTHHHQTRYQTPAGLVHQKHLPSTPPNTAAKSPFLTFLIFPFLIFTFFLPDSLFFSFLPLTLNL